MSSKPDETREGVDLTNLEGPLFDGAGVTKRELVDYLDGVSGRILAELEGRPLSVIRAHRGSEAFMQKNVPKYTPDFVPTVKYWAETSKREVSYAVCNDRRTLLWFANQRAVEYHPTLVRVDRLDHITHLVLDLDPPEGADFAVVVEMAHAVRQALADVGLTGAVKTSGPKGVPVSFPVGWDDLDGVHPRDFTIRTALGILGDADPWAEAMPEPQHLSDDLVAEGHEIPVARVQAMHEGKRRARAKRS